MRHFFQPGLWPALLLVFATFSTAPVFAVNKLDLSTAALGGISIVNAAGTAYTSTGFGGVNGLGVATSSPPTTAGVVILPAPSATLYASRIALTAHNPPSTIYAQAYVSADFGNSYSYWVCNSSKSDCATNVNSYVKVSTSAGGPTDVVPRANAIPNGSTVTAWIGIMVGDNNAMPAPPSTTITFNVISVLHDSPLPPADTLTVSAPTAVTAVSLTLGTASGPSGLTVTPQSDYAMNFGTVNGLGLGSASAGLTVLQHTNGALYSTPYQIVPSFSNFSSTTATVCISVKNAFQHTSLALYDAADGSAAGNFSLIPSSSAATTPCSPATLSSVSSRVAKTRYLGLLVSKNSPGQFSGTDHADLTFTITVP